jgi:hypothetical protein
MGMEENPTANIDNTESINETPAEVVKPGSPMDTINEFAVNSANSNKKGNTKAIMLILGLVVLIVIGVAAFFLRDKFTKPEPSPSPSPVSQLEESPSPSPAFDRSKYTLRVLNGTKTGGLAASVSAKLKDLGYQIGKTGNATGSAVAVTTIRIKGSNSELLNQLTTDLSPDYSASAGASLTDSDDVDAEVVIGNK